MRRVAAVLLLLCAPACAHSQDAEQVERERARIAAERAEVNERFMEAEKLCWKRFAVNDCIDDARTSQRAALGELRRQELALSDAERRRRSAERLRAVEQRADPQASAARRERARARQQERSERAAARAAERAAATDRSLQTPPVSAESSPDADVPDRARAQAGPDAAANRQRYEERMKQAQERKTRAQEKAAARGNSGQPAPSLPVPP